MNVEDNHEKYRLVYKMVTACNCHCDEGDRIEFISVAKIHLFLRTSCNKVSKYKKVPFSRSKLAILVFTAPSSFIG